MAHAALVCLYEPAGPLNEPDGFAAHTLQAARTAPDLAASVNFYERLMPLWDWPRVTEEIARVEENQRTGGIEAGLLKLWLQIHADDDTYLIVLGFMAENDRLRKWHIASVGELIEDIPPHLLIQFDELASFWITLHAETGRKVSNPFAFAKIGISLVLNGHSLEVKDAKKLAQTLFKDLGDADAEALRKEHMKTPEALQRLQEALSVNISPVSLPALACRVNWFSPVPTSLKPEAGLTILNQAAKKIKQIRDAETTEEHPGLRENLKKLVFHLLTDPEMKQPAHQAWLKLCTAWPDEIISHLSRCLTSEPGEIEMADDFLDLFLGQDDVDYEKIAEKVRTNRLTGRSKRLDLITELITCMERFARLSDITTSPSLNSHHIATIPGAFRFRDDVHLADMAAALISYLRETVRSPRWLTPVALHIKVLCHAHRFEEAEQIAIKHKDLKVGHGQEKEDAESFIRRAASSAKSRSVLENVSDYQRLIKIMTANWAVLCYQKNQSKAKIHDGCFP